MNNNEKMNFIGKMLTDRGLFGNSQSLAKVISVNKVSKKDKAAFTVFQTDLKALLPIAFNIYKDRIVSGNNNQNEFCDNTDLRNAMFAAIDDIINDIGAVGPGKIAKKSVIYEYAVNNCIKYSETFRGKAMYVKSQLKNVTKTLNGYLDAPNGVNEEAIRSLSVQKERLTSELNALREKPGMVTLDPVQMSEKAFISNMEKFLWTLATIQAPMTLEEYRAMKKAMREESKNKAEKAAEKNKTKTTTTKK